MTGSVISVFDSGHSHELGCILCSVDFTTKKEYPPVIPLKGFTVFLGFACGLLLKLGGGENNSE